VEIFKKMKGLLRKGPDTEGFTLIELLIVIVIIGILAGVLISVIDPAAQQARAKDATLQATMNKVALAIGSYVSAYGRIPDELEIAGSLSGFGEGAGAASCNIATEANCIFELSTVDQPTTCTSSGSWGGSVPAGTAAANQCEFLYCGGAGTDATTVACTANVTTTPETGYRLVAKAWGSTNTFLYNSGDSKLYLCDSDGENCNAIGD
jgi:prepilin-type N-terminal cleavage/methylation domain-containing protein